MKWEVRVRSYKARGSRQEEEDLNGEEDPWLETSLGGRPVYDLSKGDWRRHRSLSRARERKISLFVSDQLHDGKLERNEVAMIKRDRMYVQIRSVCFCFSEQGDRKLEHFFALINAGSMTRIWEAVGPRPSSWLFRFKSSSPWL